MFHSSFLALLMLFAVPSKSYYVKNPLMKMSRRMMSSMDAMDVKEEIMSNMGDKSRTDINELILKLEKKNPTSDPALSSLINGVWELAVCGVGSPGLFGYQVLKALSKGGPISADDVQVTISSTDPRVESTVDVKIGSAKLTVTAIAELEAISSTRLKETVIEAKIDSLSSPLPASLQKARELVVSYLDEDLLDLSLSLSL
mmetsp:Transcript_39113/g.39820  ORF Transcript_39113/g.39820 Transcript_39113/m.39820 type:complete len:201 (-) Transcript_39113:70-672(-)